MKSILVLLAASLLSSSVNAVNVPYSHSLVRRSVQVPPTLLEKKDSLVVRQGTCGVGQDACTGGGCCDGSCCGDGCCPAGYVCNFVGNTPACCPVGQICNDTISGCTDATLSECPAPYDFCCPTGQACSLDANNNAQCNGVTIGTGNGNGNGNQNGSGSSSSSSPQISQINTNVGGNNNGNNNGGISTPSNNNNSPSTVFVNNPSTTTTKSGGFHLGGAERLAVGGSVSALFAVMVGLVL